MEANEWQYTGEGGKHALFAYRSLIQRDSQPSEWHGKLLRLDKKYLRQAARSKGAEAVNNSTKVQYQSQKNQKNVEDEDPFTFLRVVMKPHFQQYLDLPTSVILPLSFVEELHHKTQMMTRPCPIPDARRKDWIPTEKDEDPQDSMPGWLIRDYRHHLPASGPCWSVEIKPKAGYLASSPLVDPKHVAKFSQSRFALLQTSDRIGYSEQIHRGWKESLSRNAALLEGLHSTSLYDPLDLFSGHPPRMNQAIEALWDSPQNNFKVWYTPISPGDKSMLVLCDPNYRVGTNTKDNTEGSNNLPDFFRQQDTSSRDDTTTTKSIIVDVISCILQSEYAFLQKLHQWQLLDILDGDGAILIYQRLVGLCHGSHREAQYLIDANFSTISQEERAGPNTISMELPVSPFTPPANHAACPAFHTLFREIRRFSNAVQALQNNFGDKDDHSKRYNHDKILSFLQEEHETSRTLCLEQIDQIQSKEACCYLLQNWLLALVVCDISFFVTLQQVPQAKQALPEPAKDMTKTASVLKPQSEGEPGIIEIATTSQGRNGTMPKETTTFQYIVKMIDCDKKPAKKLESREKKEKVFQYLHERQ